MLYSTCLVALGSLVLRSRIKMQTDLQQIRTLVAVMESLHVTLVHLAVPKKHHSTDQF